MDDNRCIIETKNGQISGLIDRTEDGTYYKFKRIPYAIPPLGNLRFLPPSIAKPWTDILDCTQDAPVPISIDVNDEIVGSEDCLYLEVSSPNVKPNKLMPVMFWIGSFSYMFYLDNICDPTLINAQDIVFVKCGHRLGPFGFLTINEFNAPGNVGLKDIVMALEWVQKNISNFGGDPSNVTLFGGSTGASTVHLMMLSPMATGLFHKGIIQSSTALNRWSLAKNPIQSTLDFAKYLGIDKTDKFEIVEELKRLPASTLIETYVDISKCAVDEDIFDSMFKPSVESEFEGQPVFLNRSPLSIIKSGNFNKVPIIIGCNNIEASLLQYLKDDFYEDYEKFNKDLSLLVPRALALDDCLSQKIALNLKDFYFGSMEKLHKDTRNQYLQLLSDYYFLYYVNKTVRTHNQVAPECPIYYYIVNYAGEWWVPEQLSFLNSIGHFGELSFLFRIKTTDASCYSGSRDSVTTRNRVIKMWTNFAKYGDPTPCENDPLLQIKWDPVVDANNLNYLSIGSELTKGKNPFYERMLFWEKLHNEHIFLRTLVYFNELGVTW